MGEQSEPIGSWLTRAWV